MYVYRYLLFTYHTWLSKNLQRTRRYPGFLEKIFLHFLFIKKRDSERNLIFFFFFIIELTRISSRESYATRRQQRWNDLQQRNLGVILTRFKLHWQISVLTLLLKDANDELTCSRLWSQHKSHGRYSPLPSNNSDLLSRIVFATYSCMYCNSSSMNRSRLFTHWREV